MPNKIIQIIPVSSNMWAKWEPTSKGENEEYSPIVCLALMEDDDGGTWVTPMSISEDGEIDDIIEFSNFGGIVFSKDPNAESQPIWHDAKTDPPKTPGLYYGKKDDTNLMWLCKYRDGKWVLDAYPETEMKIIRWAEYTAFRSVD